MIQPRVRVEGVRELNRLLRRVGGRDLQRKLGELHRRIGEMVIARAGGRQTGVGMGRGAAIRPSAKTREVVLRVGGAHRDRKADQWGVRQVWPAPHRPHLIGAALEIRPQIEAAYLAGVEDIIRQAGLD